MNNKITNIINQINDQVNEIIDLEIKNDSDGIHYEKDSSKEFLMSIAEFMHFLLSNEETSSIISNIIDSYVQMEGSTRVANINLKIRIAYNKAAIAIKGLGNWRVFCKSEEGLHEYLDPFSREHGIRNLLDSNSFINELESHTEFNGNTIEKVKTINNILVDTMYSLNGILNKYLKVGQDSAEKVGEIIENCFSVVNSGLNELEEIFKFDPQYSGFSSINELLSVYQYSHPNASPSPTANRLFLPFMMSNSKGLTKDHVSKIKRDVKRTARTIKTKLNLLPLKQLVVDRFKTYVELYRKDDYLREASLDESPEKIFQKHWEEFCFQNGYYPISEAQLSSGRIDTLVNSQNESFLTEIKQVGFGYSKTLKKAIISAVVQAESYRKKLEGYPNLSKEVYIIVFSKEAVVVTSNKKEVSGILFHLVVIQLTEVQESRRKLNSISINELIR